ncbi:MAG: transglycosylase SLT domain-containing protein [Chloroflexi bacterium]|nr:transglycosylase SLT domain-containing protein [Chloroflexota bacterium]
MEKAQLYRALAQMGFGPDPEAIDQLQRLADRAEDPEIAAQALLEAGKALEQLFRSRDAQASYEDALRRFGSADVAPQVAFRLGFARYLDKDYRGAAQAWTDLLRSEPEPEARTQALFWLGKALAAQGRKEEAQARWGEAAKLEPSTPYGLRAEAALTPTLSQGERGQDSLSPWERAGVRAQALPRSDIQGRGPAASLLERIGVKIASDQNAQEAELKRWFSDRRLDLDQAAAEAAADPDYQQAQALAALGLYREGNWQAEALLTRHAERGDRLYWLARRFHELSLFAGGLQLGQAALEASGVHTPAQAPPALREVAYPLAYGSALSAAAARQGLDPLLLAALVREESGFDPWTEAPGLARGLARLRPVRVEEAAEATGQALDPARLFEPRANLELAAWLLADRLRRYDGRMEPTLVAYTTSEGAADLWLAFQGTADPDVFLEQVPFDASRDYALGVLGSFQVYRGLYEQSQPATPAAAAPYDLGRALADIVRLRQGVAPPALLAPVPAAEAPAELRQSLGRGLELKAAGRCAEAEPLFAQALSSEVAAYAHLELAACAAGRGQHREALDHLALAQEQPGPPLLRLEARERSAESLLGLGQTEEAESVYRQLLAETKYAPYRAQLRYNLAAIERALGHRDAAVDYLRAALADDPEGMAGQAALGQLEALGARTAAPLQAGLIRFNEKRYREAIASFDAALAASPSAATAATARYHRAVSVVRLGQERQGIDDLRQLARDLPGSAEAPQALFKAGRVLESLKEYRQAATVYQELAAAYPGSTYAPDARFRAGLAAYQQGSLRAAAEAWRALIASGADPEVAAQAQFWLGKALQGQGDQVGARTTWERLAARSPDGYYGLRAADLLAGRVRPELGQTSPQPEALAFSEADRVAVARWAAGQGATPAQLEAEPGFRRARTLLSLGLRAEARWELEALATQWGNNGGRLALLAAQLNTWGVYDLSLKSALRASWAASGAPRALQKLIYPVPYPELVADQAARQSADPLLFSALMRQESLFDQFARSPSHARGLTQLIPSTGYDVAQRLGRTSFQVADLYRPEVSVEFGAWYLARHVERYRGMPLPAIASYNGGDWAVDSWLLAYGDEDPDAFVEGIPFSETQPYVQRIYEFWQTYRSLYEPH